VSNTRVELNRLALIAQGDLAVRAGRNRMQKLKPHARGTDVRAAACQRLARYRELDRKINQESWVSILKSLHMFLSSLKDTTIILFPARL
jgi:hypothetical protein